MIGRVTLVNYKQGYGFINSEIGDVFFHSKDIINSCINNLSKNSIVTYVLLYGNKGLYAKQVYQQK